MANKNIRKYHNQHTVEPCLYLCPNHHRLYDNRKLTEDEIEKLPISFKEIYYASTDLERRTILVKARQEITANYNIKPKRRRLKVDDLPRKGSKRYCELVTKVQGGEPFTRRIVVHGRPYWQRCRYVYKEGKRKLEVLKHLGTRKPRG